MSFSHYLHGDLLPSKHDNIFVPNFKPEVIQAPSLSITKRDFAFMVHLIYRKQKEFNT